MCGCDGDVWCCVLVIMVCVDLVACGLCWILMGCVFGFGWGLLLVLYCLVWVSVVVIVFVGFV